jgi:hypothetical protein
MFWHNKVQTQICSIIAFQEHNSAKFVKVDAKHMIRCSFKGSAQLTW